MREFRNDVIHKGKIPTKNEVLAFGNAVLAVLTEGVRTVRENYEEYRGALMGKRAMTFKMGKHKDQTVGGMGLSTIVSLINLEHIPTSIEDGLEGLVIQREKLQSFELIQTLISNTGKS